MRLNLGTTLRLLEASNGGSYRDSPWSWSPWFNGLTIAKGGHDDKMKAKCLRSGSRLMRTGNHGHAICSSCALSLDGKPEQ